MQLRLVTALVLACAISLASAQTPGPLELGGLRVPPAGSTSVDTNATFAIGLTTDHGINWRSAVGSAEDVRVVGKVRPLAAHSGQNANVFLVIRTGNAFLMRNSSGAFLQWSGAPSELVPYRQNLTLSADTEIDLFTGRLGVSGEFQLFLGYQANDGVLHYSARPFGLTVNNTAGGGNSGAQAAWNFDGSSWKSAGTPPACPSPLLQTPVDLAKATSILYPGQIRGGNYKPHGGFRFDSAGQSNQISVRSAIAGTVFRGVRYIESGVIQYMFDIIDACGVMMRLDHLLDLSPKFAAIANTLPAATSSSATTQVTGQSVIIGETIATAVGLPGNVFIDFGIYDLRSRNPVATNEIGELRPYGICWFDALPAADASIVRALPGADGVAGKTSDYCR